MTQDEARKLRAEYMDRLKTAMRAMAEPLDHETWKQLRPGWDTVWQSIGAMESIDLLESRAGTSEPPHRLRREPWFSTGERP